MFAAGREKSAENHGKARGRKTKKSAAWAALFQGLGSPDRAVPLQLVENLVVVPAVFDDRADVGLPMLGLARISGTGETSFFGKRLMWLLSVPCGSRGSGRRIPGFGMAVPSLHVVRFDRMFFGVPVVVLVFAG